MILLPHDLPGMTMAQVRCPLCVEPSLNEVRGMKGHEERRDTEQGRAVPLTGNSPQRGEPSRSIQTLLFPNTPVTHPNVSAFVSTKQLLSGGVS